MNLAPDIGMRAVTIGGTDGRPLRTYHIAHCYRCGCELEPNPSLLDAHIVAGQHLKLACLADSGAPEETA